MALTAAPSGRMVPRMTTDHDIALPDFFAGLGSALDRARRTHEADLAAFFAGLGPVVAAARRAQAVLDRKQAMLDRRVAPQFSVFDYSKEQETNLSCAFGRLLDPAGTHGQDDVFLELFLGEIRRLREDFPYPDTRGCKVYLEYTTNGGRIDIVLEMPGKHWIGIENKPWAAEQENQVTNYMTYLEELAESVEGGTAWILYLSGDGSDPETTEGLSEEQISRCLTMPYRTRNEKLPSVENWIRRCGERCEAERVRWFLKDFLEYVEKNFRLAGAPEAQRVRSEIMTSDIIATVEYIIDSEQHLDLAFRVEEAMPIVRKRLVEEVVKDVKEGFSKKDYRVFFADYGDVMEGRRSLIALRKHDWRKHDNEDRMTGIHLESEKDFSAPYYICLYLHESYSEGKEEDIVKRFKEFNQYGRRRGTAGDLLRKGILWKEVKFGGSEDFFKRAANSEKREDLVKQFIRMIDEMAAKIDDTMKNLGRNA